ncbi:MAG: hypothetical protein JSV84_01375 [Gemmatimonadota bacterium]|nr:MAG: hypothetical protein JSV84_01375 [Gemmatimonadota bacterium]
MKKRVAQKILRYRDRLHYSEPQMKRAEETLKEIEKRRSKRKGKKPEQRAETQE